MEIRDNKKTNNVFPIDNDIIANIPKNILPRGLNFTEIRVLSILIGKANKQQIEKIANFIEEKLIQLKTRISKGERV